MQDIHGISFTLFIVLTAIVLFIGYVTLYTSRGKRFIKKYLPSHRVYWRLYLIIALVLIFVMLNPLLHFILGMVGGLLYYLLIIRGGEVFRKNKGNSLDQATQLRLSIQPESNDNPKENYLNLKAKLFSFPYIDHSKKPDITLNDDTFEVHIRLTQARFTDSFIKYLNNAGLHTTLND